MALSQHSHARNARAKHARPSRAARRLAVLAATGATLATSGVLTSAPAQAADGATVVTVASHYAGDPYLWGGTTPAGFDCSGYVQYVYRQVGISLPRTTNQQYAAVQHIRSDQKRPGDVLFLPDGSGNIYHEGIYAGGNSWWVAAHAGTVIMLQTVYTTNYLVGRPASVVAGSGITVPPPTLVAKPLSAYRGWLMGLGWRHPAVAALQPVLGVRPADGEFGPQTAAALIAYQKAHHLPGTGVTDAATWAALLAAPTVPAPPVAAAKPLSAYRGWLMGLGWVHPAVAALQPALGVRPVDGQFGPQTAAALIAYQKAHHLPATGVTDTATWAVLAR